jgi:hypothetical protein
VELSTPRRQKSERAPNGALFFRADYAIFPSTLLLCETRISIPTGFAMPELDNLDLATDAMAASFVKHEVVGVMFAVCDGVLASREGENRYRVGDALITSANGGRWSVSQERFEGKYEPLSPTVSGEAGNYRAKPIPVLAKQMQEPFSIARSNGGDVLRGKAQDWLLQYAPGDYGIVECARFAKVYRPQSG